jgi:hypothetical protein
MIEPSGKTLNQATGCRPTMRKIAATRPLTGSSSRFFQTSAETVGMTKKGEIISTRAKPWPRKGWLKTAARIVPRTMVMAMTPTTMMTEISSELSSAGSSKRYLKFRNPAQPWIIGLSRL